MTELIDLSRRPERATARRRLSGHPPQEMRAWLRALADSPEAAGRPDRYGRGAVLQSVQTEVAALLGMPSAVFVIKGVMAQQAVLRSWTDRRGAPSVAVHPLSHIDLDEASAYERLHGLRPVRLGHHRPFTSADLEKVAERLGAVVVELPLRRAGHLLPSWDELVAISDWCRAHGVPLHLDGARLWESATGLGHSPAEIAALADSVYVSFYKGLGGLGGCALLAPADVLAEAGVWITRHGGSMFAAFPYALAALAGLRTELPRMDAHHRRAAGLAAAIAAADGLAVVPDPPHTNAFQVHLDAPPEAVAEAVARTGRDTGVWLSDRVSATARPGTAMIEVTVGPCTADVPDEEAATLLAGLI
ncbi:MAG TPA: beta-eliminating lyase-related protein [Mycobacteriales bacterium]|nr:beta-eliminating lyase-related protein [Mycobacteriales bacterium]